MEHHHIWTVHVSRPDEIGAVEIIFSSERDARAYAKDRSRDHRVLAAAVTRFAVGELGTRHPVGWYRDGVEQPVQFHDRQLYPSAPPERQDR